MGRATFQKLIRSPSIATFQTIPTPAQNNLMKTPPLIAVTILCILSATPRSSAATSVTTQPAGNLSPNNATLNGTVTPGGQSTSVYFEFGATINYGNLTALTSIGSGGSARSVSARVTGLLAGSAYHFRAVATNSSGITQGNDLEFTPPVFTRTETALSGLASSAVAWGDFNNDGKLDLLMTGTDDAFSPRSQVLQNIGTNRFINLNAGLPGLPSVSSGSVVWGDFDNDGKLDFLLTGFAGLDANHFPILVSQIWRNLGGGAFANINAGLPGTDTGSAAWGDFDDDGNIDLLLTGHSSLGAIAQIWRNQGNGTFTRLNAGLTGVLYSSVALGDFDGDGKVDILLAGTTNGFVAGAITQVWRNRGNGVFSNINAGLPGISQGTVTWGHFGNDDRLDILLTGYSSTGPIAQIWRNLGDGVFTNMHAGLPGVSQSAVAVGDFDNDDRLDVLLSGVDASTNTICQLWRNSGEGAFTSVSTGLPGVRSGSLAWADFDNDGRLDLVLTGYDSDNKPFCGLYHNHTALGNSLQPHLLDSKKLSDGRFQFSFKGKTGLGYLISTSTNLIDWTPLAAPRESSQGTFHFRDTGAGISRAQFYRTTIADF